MMKLSTGILILGLLNLACTSLKSSSQTKFPQIQVQLDGRALAILSLPEALLSQAYVDKSHRIWLSVFSLPKDFDSQILVSRRRKAFENLFVDERDPYTGIENPKSRCLVQTSDSAIRFLSGPESQWPECRLPSKFRNGLRIWKACGNFLWEVTFQSEVEKDLPQIKCELSH